VTDITVSGYIAKNGKILSLPILSEIRHYQATSGGVGATAHLLSLSLSLSDIGHTMRDDLYTLTPWHSELLTLYPQYSTFSFAVLSWE
jgi:hypothetical protein